MVTEYLSEPVMDNPKDKRFMYPFEYWRKNKERYSTYVSSDGQEIRTYQPHQALSPQKVCSVILAKLIVVEGDAF